jgi:hypothetical protein
MFAAAIAVENQSSKIIIGSNAVNGHATKFTMLLRRVHVVDPSINARAFV